MGYLTSEMSRRYARGAEQCSLAPAAAAGIVVPIEDGSSTPSDKRPGRRVTKKAWTKI